MTENNPGASSGGTTRRSFLVRMSGAILGSFFLPALSTAKASESEEEESIRDILMPPIKKYVSDKHYFLLWLEQADGSQETMIWQPDDEPSRREAQRFYEETRGYSKPIKMDELPPLPRRSEEENRLIKAVLDNLDDLAPRRAYGDYLRRQGNTLGDFIVNWIDMDKLPPNDPRSPGMNQRFEELYNKHSEDWFAPLTALTLRPMLHGVFYPILFMTPAGLIEDVEITRPGVLPEHADYLFNAAPVINKLTLNYEPIDLEGISRLPQMQQIVSLALTWYDHAGLRALAHSPHFQKLKTFKLTGPPHGKIIGQVLGTSKLFPQLTCLDVSSMALADSGVKALCATSRPLSLTHLDVGYNHIRDEGLMAITRTSGLRQLKELQVKENFFTHEGLETFQNAGFAQGLQLLDLSGCRIRVDGIAALSSAPFTSLATLALGENPLGNEGITKLAEADFLRSVRALNLAKVSMDDDGLEALLRSPHLRELHELNIDQNQIGARGFKALAQCTALRNLRVLRASWNQCGDEGLQALAQSPYLSKLMELYLTDTKLTSKGIEALASSPALGNVQQLALDANPIDDYGVAALIDSTGFREVSFLTIDLANLSETGAQALANEFGQDVVGFK